MADIAQIMFTPRHLLYAKFKALKGSIITIEGGIGVGKTTLGTSMVRVLNGMGLSAEFFPEYVNTNFRDTYIGDMKQYAFAFQIFLLSKRIQIYENAQRFAATGGIAIIDRSIVGDMTFAKMQVALGNMSAQDWNVYLDIMQSEIQLEPAATIYLECTVDTALERIQHRGIESEIQGYSREYIQMLTDSYAASIASAKNINCITLDWNTHAPMADGLLVPDFIVSILCKLL